MAISSIIVVFSFSWWFLFFMLLPLGIQPSDGSVPGQSTGAPAKTGLRKKAIWATVLAILVTGIFYAVVASGKWSIQEMLGVTDWKTYEDQLQKSN